MIAIAPFIRRSVAARAASSAVATSSRRYTAASSSSSAAVAIENNLANNLNHPQERQCKNNSINTAKLCFFSTSPDYTNYETWHRSNYEDAEHQQQQYDVSTKAASMTATASAASAFNPEGPRTSVLMELTDSVGALHDVLRFL